MDDERVSSLSKQICISEDDSTNAQLIFDWVRESIEYRVIGLESAGATLSRGQGCCLAKSNLVVALARSVGIPARYRQFSGYLNSPDKQIARLFHQHIISELFIKGNWVAGDPAYGHAVSSVYETGELGKQTWHDLRSDKTFAALPWWLWLAQRLLISISPAAHLVRRKVLNEKNRTV